MSEVTLIVAQDSMLHYSFKMKEDFKAEYQNEDSPEYLVFTSRIRDAVSHIHRVQ